MARSPKRRLAIKTTTTAIKNPRMGDLLCANTIVITENAKSGT
jgi:hypothetical protein